MAFGTKAWGFATKVGRAAMANQRVTGAVVGGAFGGMTGGFPGLLVGAGLGAGFRPGFMKRAGIKGGLHAGGFLGGLAGNPAMGKRIGMQAGMVGLPAVGMGVAGGLGFSAVSGAYSSTFGRKSSSHGNSFGAMQMGGGMNRPLHPMGQRSF